jgi:hypothetical protein
MLFGGSVSIAEISKGEVNIFVCQLLKDFFWQAALCLLLPEIFFWKHLGGL